MELMVYSNTTVYGENELVLPVTCIFSSLFEAHTDAFEMHFFRALFLHNIKGTDSM